MTVVGAFVLGAIALGVAAIIVLSSGALFRDTFTVVSLFPGSVQGLQIGAPVTFRGVQIGTVKEIRLLLPNDPRLADPENTDARIPILYEIDNTLLQARGGTREINEERIAELVQAGLRAQLSTESFVTGRLLLALDFQEDQAVIVDDWDLGYPQIPALPQPIEEIQHQLAAVFDKLAEVEVDSILYSAKRAIDAFAEVAEDTKMEELTQSLENTLAQLDQTMVSFRDVATKVSDNFDEVAESAAARARQLEAVFDEAQTTMRSVQTALDPSAPLTIQLGLTLYELEGAARALKVLSQSLEQNPSAVIRGRPVPEGNR
jgi:paraquat-inducible protein B